MKLCDMCYESTGYEAKRVCCEGPGWSDQGRGTLESNFCKSLSQENNGLNVCPVCALKGSLTF